MYRGRRTETILAPTRRRADKGDGDSPVNGVDPTGTTVEFKFTLTNPDTGEVVFTAEGTADSSADLGGLASGTEAAGGNVSTNFGGGKLASGPGSTSGIHLSSTSTSSSVSTNNTSIQGPNTDFGSATAALGDAQKWVMSQPEDMRAKGEYSGEVDQIGKDTFTYDTSRYREGNRSRNLVRRETVFAFHSHPTGGAEAPSSVDFKGIGDVQARPGFSATGALFTPRGDIRT